MRIAVVHIGQETNTYNPIPTTLDDFRAFGIYRDAEMFDDLVGLGQVGGYLDACAETRFDVESVAVVRAWAVAGGRIDAETHEYFLDVIRNGLAAAGEIDGVALQLHGACSADGIDDVEGAQLALCREILGPDLPIVLSLDHHANVTEAMVEMSSAIVGHRTQPHDPVDTGRIAAHLLFRIVAGEVRPVMAWRKIPLLSHQEQYLTSVGPMQVWFDRARAIETEDAGVLQVSNFPMQPWLDVDGGGWATVVVTDRDARLAEERADELADLAWSMRESFQVKESITADEAVRQAHGMTGLVMLSDTGDSVFGGSAGDSNVILESILRLGLGSRCIMPLVSPRVAAALHEAGEGATVTIAVGGDAAPFFEPLEVTGVVRRLSSGRVAVTEHSQPFVDMGRTAVFDVGPVTMLVTELRGLGGNVPEVYQANGVDPVDYRMVVLKTASNFQYFRPLSSGLIRVDTPGPTQSDIIDLRWERMPRPVFPLDDIDDRRAPRQAMA